MAIAHFSWPVLMGLAPVRGVTNREPEAPSGPQGKSTKEKGESQKTAIFLLWPLPFYFSLEGLYPRTESRSKQP
jgi:hypothetical protein